MQRDEVPVLVVGAGPVGLLGGILLSRQGVASRVIERRKGPRRAPAAHVVGPRTFEICRAAGVSAEAIRAACTDPADARHVRWVTTLAGEELGRLAFEQQGREALAITPTPLRNLAQSRFEPILLDTLQKAPDAEVVYGQRWEAAEEDADGVTSRVRDLASDEVREIRSRYLLGADGAGSAVRRQLGIEMQGPARLETFLMIHFAANLRPLVGERPAILYWISDPEAGGTFIAHDIDREWVYMHRLEEDESGEDYPKDRCAALVRRAIGVSDQPLEITGAGTWAMTAQVAESYGEGRILLAGDSAHRFPPTGGLGLNTGAQDVHGLAWRLAAVLAGWAPASLLASYEAERRPVAQANADQSLRNAYRLLEVPQALGLLEERTTARMRASLADGQTRARVTAAIANQAEHFDTLGLQLGYVYEQGALLPDATDPELRPRSSPSEFTASGRAGARLPHAWVERDGESVSSLDLLWPQGFTLLCAAPNEAWAAAAAAVEGVPLRHVALGAEALDPEGRWAELAGLEPDGAVLVRPDQHVAWRARRQPRDPAKALGDALARILGRGAA